MFRFLEIALHNWDLWPPVRVPLDRPVILLSGPNGSGKTTFLDAIRQLLNASRLSSKRKLLHYLRRPDQPALVYAVVSNDGGGNGAPPFRHEKVVTPTATLACALVPASSGSPEKRYAILPGKATPEELQRLLLESKNFLLPERYSRALEHAGVTRSLLGVLAIEQGRMNALSEQSPRQLFSYVIEMLGDRAVLERYRESRRRYEDTEREVAAQMKGLQGLQIQLEQLRRQVQRREEWEAAHDKVGELEARLPAAHYQEAWQLREGIGSKINELRTKVRNGEAEQKRLAAEVRSAEAAADQAESERTRAQEQEAKAVGAWGDAKAAVAESAGRVRRLEEVERKLASIAEGDLTALEETCRAARSAEFEAAARTRSLTAHASEVRTRIGRLEAGLPVYPDEVTKTLEALHAEGIEVTLLATRVSPADPARAEAAEAALGDARYAIVVARDRAPRAVEIAKGLDFPGPVSSDPPLPGPATLSWLLAEPGAPAWLDRWAGSVELHADGTWKDDRGQWVRRPREHVLGAEGLRAQLQAARRELEDVERDLGLAQMEETRRTAARKSAEVGVEAELGRRRLAEERDSLASARDEQADAATLEKAAHERLVEARRVGRGAVEEEMRRRADLDRARNALGTHERQLVGERQRLEEDERRVQEADAQLRVLEPGLSDELRALARKGSLEAASTVQRDRDRAADAFRKLAEPPGPEVRDEHKHLLRNVEEAEKHVQDRQAEANRAQAELSECRKRYLEVVDGALQDYRRRAVELGRRAEVEVHMDLPSLDEDDQVLDEAGIDARFGFDGKDPLSLGDSSFSGGQQVICGLILLMAMAETEGDGFFLLDEPFAHLSLDRVDDVGRFLRSTRAQFLLTAPTTLDRGQLDPASMLIVMKKKRPGETLAPVPLVAVS